VVDLPLSKHPRWQPHLQAIYAAIGVDERRIVRSLLAAMPAGVEIPTHHDTGEWVRRTHRIHVPIVTGDDVDFLVGPSEDAMVRMKLDEGRIIELNNQAKHAVKNRMDRYRTHLIFDYLDDIEETDTPSSSSGSSMRHVPIRHTVPCGAILRQTRRSIDLVGKRRFISSSYGPTPTLINATHSQIFSLTTHTHTHTPFFSSRI
jgi:hypothetical protein